MTPADLLPCPFCGGAVTLERVPDSSSFEFGTRKWWGVKCRNTINLGGTCAIEAVPTASPEAAIARWNRRADLASVRDSWIPVGERLPDVDHNLWLVVVTNDAGYQRVTVEFYHFHEGWATDENVTHWMPLKTAPKG